MTVLRAFAMFSLGYTTLVCYYSFLTPMRFYGAGLMLPTLLLIPIGAFFARSVGLLSSSTISGKSP